MVLVLGLQRLKRGWSRGFPTVDAKWIAGARAENQVDISDRRGPRPWTHTNILEIITQGLLIMRKISALSPQFEFVFKLFFIQWYLGLFRLTVCYWCLGI